MPMPTTYLSWVKETMSMKPNENANQITNGVNFDEGRIVVTQL